MRGMAVEEAYLGFNGFHGDRRYAFVFRALAASDGFPWFTARDAPRLILYTPRFAFPPTATREAKDAEPVIVRTPEGDEYDVTDTRLGERIAREAGQPVFLFKTTRGAFDSQPVSLFNLASLRDLEIESGSAIDHRQFRANLYFEPVGGNPFDEDEWVGRILRIGKTATVGITKKDTRCMMINLDPETASQNPQVLRAVTHLHQQQAGIYATVITPGMVRVGDAIQAL